MDEDKQSIMVTITDMKTGRDGVLVTEGHWEDGTFNDYMWSEGNYACDCNRGLFLYRDCLGGGKDPDIPCGSARFSVVIRDEMGDVLYADGQTTSDAARLCLQEHNEERR